MTTARVSIVIATALALLGSKAEAGPEATAARFTAEFYLGGCKDFIAGRSNNFLAGRCVGAVEVLDALNSDTKQFCPPDKTDNLLRIRTIVSYIEARPERKSEDFRLLANEAMVKAWPCKN